MKSGISNLYIIGVTLYFITSAKISINTPQLLSVFLIEPLHDKEVVCGQGITWSSMMRPCPNYDYF